MIQDLKQYIHRASLLSTTNRKISASIVFETNKSNLAQEEPMKKKSGTTIESGTTSGGTK